jgi:hypothetical protein
MDPSADLRSLLLLPLPMTAALPAAAAAVAPAPRAAAVTEPPAATASAAAADDTAVRELKLPDGSERRLSALRGGRKPSTATDAAAAVTAAVP